MRKTGETKKGSAARRATMRAKATYWWPMVRGVVAAGSTDSLATAMSLRPAEQPGRLPEEDPGHDDEDDRVGGLRVEHLGQPLDHTQGEAGDDGAHDGAHPARDHHPEDDDDQGGAHQGVDLVDGGGEHPRQRGEP